MSTIRFLQPTKLSAACKRVLLTQITPTARCNEAGFISYKERSPCQSELPVVTNTNWLF